MAKPLTVWISTNCGEFLYKFPDGRDWLWGKLGLALVGRAMLSKSLIQLSADGWGCVSPCWLFGLEWPSPRVYSLFGGANGEFQEGLCQHVPPRTAATSSPVPTPGYCQSRPLRETLKHSQAGLAQSLVGSLLPSPGSWCTQSLFVPSKSLCFLQSCGSSIIKFCCPSKSVSLGIPSPFVWNPDWEVCCRA